MKDPTVSAKDKAMFDMLNKYPSVKMASIKENIPRSVIDNWSQRQREKQVDARLYLNILLAQRNRGGVLAKILKPRKKALKVPDEEQSEEEQELQRFGVTDTEN